MDLHSRDTFVKIRVEVIVSMLRSWTLCSCHGDECGCCDVTVGVDTCHGSRLTTSSSLILSIGPTSPPTRRENFPERRSKRSCIVDHVEAHPTLSTLRSSPGLAYLYLRFSTLTDVVSLDILMDSGETGPPNFPERLLHVKIEATNSSPLSTRYALSIAQHQ